MYGLLDDDASERFGKLGKDELRAELLGVLAASSCQEEFNSRSKEKWGFVPAVAVLFEESAGAKYAILGDISVAILPIDGCP
jgi:hypothetical protein